jgi:hypothetical protein
MSTEEEKKALPIAAKKEKKALPIAAEKEKKALPIAADKKKKALPIDNTILTFGGDARPGSLSKKLQIRNVAFDERMKEATDSATSENERKAKKRKVLYN